MKTKPWPRVAIAWGKFREALALARLDDYALNHMRWKSMMEDDEKVPVGLAEQLYLLAQDAQRLSLAAEEYAQALDEQEKK